MVGASEAVMAAGDVGAVRAAGLKGCGVGS